MKPSLLIIDNYDSFTYNLIQMVEERGGYDWVMMKNDEIDFDAVNRFKKILISPGPGIPSEAGDLIKLIKQFAQGKSILGVCLGHQAIAEAFGGKLTKLANVVHGQKKEVIVYDRTEYLFKGLPEKFEVGLYHSWAVSAKQLPHCLRITAKASDGIIMALKHKQFDVKGIQFHPESVMTAAGKKIILNWLKH